MLFCFLIVCVSNLKGNFIELEGASCSFGFTFNKKDEFLI